MTRASASPDIGLARQALQWEPKVQLREGLGRTIEYFDALLRSDAKASAVAVQQDTTHLNPSNTLLAH